MQRIVGDKEERVFNRSMVGHNEERVFILVENASETTLLVE